MSFTDRATARPTKPLAPCRIRTILDGLSPAEADALRVMLADNIEDRSHTSLVIDLTDEGYVVSDSTVGKHRRGECSCRQLVTT